MSIQDKALTAVAALADLVKAMRIDGDQVAVDRYDYEQLLANQSDTYAEQLSHAMQRAFDLSPVALSYKERRDMVLDYASKPAGAYTFWSYDKEADYDGCHLRQSSGIEFGEYDTIHLRIPSGYTKEEALQGLKDLVEYIESTFDVANESAQDIAKRRLPSSIGIEGKELPF